MSADRVLFEQGRDEDLVEVLRDATNRGLVPGSDRFRHEIAATLGRRVVPPRRGRPPKGRPVAPAQDVARRIRWVSEEDGDGAGYDILSFETDGSDRLIEVKTTNGWERTPFHITRHELTVAGARRDDWRLVRVWNFAREPKAFELRPPLEAHVSLMATSYEANFS